MHVQHKHSLFQNWGPHYNISWFVSTRREKGIAFHNKAESTVSSSFSIDDFVLARGADDRTHKQIFRWYSPCRITAVLTPPVCSGSFIHDGSPDKARCYRLMKFGDSLLGKLVAKHMTDLAEGAESRHEPIDETNDVDDAPDGLFFRVRWEVLQKKWDWI